MLKVALLLAILPAVAFGGRIAFNACKAGDAVPNWIDIEGCDRSSCKIHSNVDMHLQAELNVAFSSTRLMLNMTVVMGNMPAVPYTLPVSIHEACNIIVGGCPVEAGQTRLANTTLTLYSPAGGFWPTIRLFMTNENKKELMCIETQIKVTA